MKPMSPVQTVLLAMKPSPRRDQINQTLEQVGLKVLRDETLKEAMESLRYRRPDLILAALELGDARDAEVVASLRGDVRGALLPLVVITGATETMTRVQLFEMGVDGILREDVSGEELAAQATMMLKRYRKLGAVLPDAESIDRKKITLLQVWAKDVSEQMRPTSSVISHLGYTYERAREHFACTPGTEIEHLEDLATRMCLERKFYDRIHLCPQCGHFAINFREISPKSKSPDISRVDMLHHFKCGHVAPVRDFVSGLDYICPKDNVQLRHVGVDYERLGQVYVDNQTGETFAECETDCVCLSCGFVSDPEHLAERSIYTYTISERGLLAAETGYLYEVSLDTVLMDHDLQIYNPTYFRRQLGIEIERAKRYKRHLSVALLRLDQYEAFLRQYGEKSRHYLARVAETIKSNTRASDLIARHEQNSIIMLFPETDLEGARNACEKLRGAVLKLATPRPDIHLTVSCGVSAYPDFAENQQELLKSAAECFAKAQEMEGNIVVTAGTAGKGA
jgi:diguanylate cyclase (GGDEF)-like protein